MEILELKRTINEMKNLLEGLSSSFEQEEERICFQSEEQKEKEWRIIKIASGTCTTHQAYQHTHKESLGEKREKETDFFEKVMAGNFSNLIKNINLHI